MDFLNNSTFWRVCDSTGKCHCDFRYTIWDCAETNLAKHYYLAIAIIIAVLTCVNIFIIYHLVFMKKQKVFEIRNGFPRPRPMESMAVFGLVFNILQLLQAIIMLTDSIKNAIFRSFMHDIGFQFGYACLTCYLFGVAYTLSDTSSTVYRSWVVSDTIMNILFLLSSCLPFLTNNIISIMAGHYAGQNNIRMASLTTKIQYYLWTFYCVYLGTLLLGSGIRLLRLLNRHLLARSDLRSHADRFKLGALRVKIIVVVGSSVLYVFAFMLVLYNLCRDAVLTDVATNMLITGIWLSIGPIAVFFVELALLLNPTISKQISQLSFGISAAESQYQESPYHKDEAVSDLNSSSKSELVEVNSPRSIQPNLSFQA